MPRTRRPANAILDLAIECLQMEDLPQIKAHLAQIAKLAGAIRADTGLSDTSYQRKHRTKKDAPSE